MFPLVKVTTSDKVLLAGMFIPGASKTCVIFIHGTASSFFDEDWTEQFADACKKAGAAFLTINNRGAGLYLDLWNEPWSGSATELFEDCVKDIDAWTAFARKQGMKRIILVGHSLGTEKIVYYLSRGQHRKLVVGAVLLAPADTYGNQLKIMGKQHTALLVEARAKVAAGKGLELLSTWGALSGFIPKTAVSYLSFFAPNSESSKTMSFHRQELPAIRALRIPILVVIGDRDPYTVIPVPQALALLRAENPSVETHLLKTDHEFTGKEHEMLRLVQKFIHGNI